MSVHMKTPNADHPSPSDSTSITLEVHFLDEHFPELVLGKINPRPGCKADIPGGATLTYLGSQVRRGALPGVPQLAEFALSFGLGASSSLVANWIYEKFKGKVIRVSVNRTLIEVAPDGFLRIINEQFKH